MDCCPTDNTPHKKKRFDWLFWSSLIILLQAYIIGAFFQATELGAKVSTFTQTIYHLMNTIWWGILLGILFSIIIGLLPSSAIVNGLGRAKGYKGYLRAVALGAMLDMCSHGILMVGAKLYQKGARFGQVVAFLLASPWNSFSITIILISLIGVSWTLAFVMLSLVIALLTGWAIDTYLRHRNHVPYLEYSAQELPPSWQQIKQDVIAEVNSWAKLKEVAINGLRESRMLLRWLFLGVILTATLKTFVSAEMLQTYLGPTALGLFITLVFATIMEVCSEGSVPIAAEIMNTASAPGNAFTYLMAGVATDSTEFLVLREATKTWRLPLLMPLFSVPQILFVAYILNLLT